MCLQSYIGLLRESNVADLPASSLHYLLVWMITGSLYVIVVRALKQIVIRVCQSAYWSSLLCGKRCSKKK